MKILLVDDHDMFRDGISMLLHKEYPDIILYQAKDLVQALNILAEFEQPDMILLDLHLQSSSPVENIRSIKSRYPSIPVTVISGEERPEFIRNIMSYDINAYIPKTVGNTEFMNAIKTVLRGRSYLPPSVASEIERGEAMGAQSLDNLTQRQKMVLSLMAQGISNQEIADKLNISKNTISVHVKNILKILNASNRTEAGFLAVKYGLI
ncbi:response regulator transcription factor [Aliikangiella sp. G2MR2-5]|uniref:LuxR C-terminal-related transcriptional regulator n=1 Tax=Aliikangiella sp. G2MR2-5 TaxID=2788943 RepID=UPI0018ABE1F3|nr:response regulator transcription factor [Aliikangiella sp. G2MR2-5]